MENTLGFEKFQNTKPKKQTNSKSQHSISKHVGWVWGLEFGIWRLGFGAWCLGFCAILRAKTPEAVQGLEGLVLKSK